MALVGGAQLAKAMNVTLRRVQQLVADGMPKKSEGRYDLVPCLEFYVRFLQAAVAQRQSLTGRAAPSPTWSFSIHSSTTAPPA
jgi:phage terminase Nu1 subunit (DNA packaging protein)